MCVSAREAAAVDQAGVVFGVGVDGIFAVHQRGDRAQICGETGGEYQRGLGAFELGEAAFEFGVGSGMAGDERTGSCAEAFLLGGFGGGGGEARIGGQAEIIVGAKIYERAAVDFDGRGLRTGAGHQSAAQVALVEGGKFGVEPVQGIRHGFEFRVSSSELRWPIPSLHLFRILGSAFMCKEQFR